MKPIAEALRSSDLPGAETEYRRAEDDMETAKEDFEAAKATFLVAKARFDKVQETLRLANSKEE